MTSLINTPFTISDDVFGISDDAVLYVPKGTKSVYESTSGWNKFKTIIEITNKCYAPTISYINGQLKFECKTEDVVFKTCISDEDIKNYSESVIDLSVTYNINVYATKSGYENSDTISAALCWIDANPQTEGIENGMAEVAANPILIQSSSGTLSIAGAKESADIAVYTTSGIMVGAATANGSSTSITTGLRNGEMAIVKIGERSVKVLMR